MSTAAVPMRDAAEDADAVAEAVGPPRPAREPRVSLRTVRVLMRKELRDAVRNRWFAVYALGFTVMSLGVSYLSQVGTGYAGFAGFGPTAASMINLVLLMVPLMALTLGASSLPLERERGMLAYVLAQPVSRVELLLAKYLGLCVALLGALALGFGVAGLVLATRVDGQHLGLFVRLVCFSGLLAVAMLSVGVMISAWARGPGSATGFALLAWLVFLFLGDLGLMGSAVVFRLQTPELFLAATVNPTECFRLAVIGGFDATLDVLGPAGHYAFNRFGPGLPWVLAGVLVAWVVVPLGLALVRFHRRPL